MDVIQISLLEELRQILDFRLSCTFLEEWFSAL